MNGPNSLQYDCSYWCLRAMSLAQRRACLGCRYDLLNISLSDFIVWITLGEERLPPSRLGPERSACARVRAGRRLGVSVCAEVVSTL